MNNKSQVFSKIQENQRVDILWYDVENPVLFVVVADLESRNLQCWEYKAKLVEPNLELLADVMFAN